MEEKRPTFEELCLPHLDAAYILARLLLRSDQDAQDVVQEAYVRALKGFKGFRGDNARPWLMMIVRNTAYSWFKKHAKEANMIPFDPAIHATSTGQPLSDSSREERIQQLREAFNRLPIESRKILALREMEGLSYEQLASALKVPLGTVMSRLSRARQRLREEFAGIRHTELQDEL
jgi:RNA polymerase sigma-70 factor (ECF subfamily)